MYLRKSRADAEAEAHGEGETLARHQKILLSLSKRLNITITKIYSEIVSGETIASRPVMQHLLGEVEQGLWAGVLVMEIERLARGNTLDQGFVAQAFKYSGTKIYTPMKTYDPNNEFDEEYFEFGLFMSRREYKTINRRLQSGRVASIKEGKYVGNIPPYGYERKKLEHDKGFTLEAVEDQSAAVRLMYDLYVNNSMGPDLIAKRLDHLGYKPLTTEYWSPATIRGILENPVYIGLVRWNGRMQVKNVIAGKIVKSRPRNKEAILIKGLHKPIINEEVWEAAQRIRENHIRPRLNSNNAIIKNPLAGLIECGVCGKKMVRRPYLNGQADTLICRDSNCNNVSSYLYIVEEKLLDSLSSWLEELKINFDSNSPNASNPDSNEVIYRAIKKAESEKVIINKQIENLHDLLEQEIYTIDIFLERSKKLAEKQQKIIQTIAALNSELKQKDKKIDYKDMIVKIENILQLYNALPSAHEKNQLLKSVLKKVIYIKNEGGRYSGKERAFSLELYPLLPK
ncbi:recombinase family protein [Sinanaerobacter sp. ZZT-01]|uniref:recombinase family protein n=1 Tax=Sinanaerobacter sp. ZZT-01 TaxID=3111540 RepID=UPI002D76D1E1|nr:recombinase family protein [Sinanaerobacter sp. ZZT-01]WRR95057.1 recombinase family protein [Sinanaerobacter sp. ZZT-01]